MDTKSAPQTPINLNDFEYVCLPGKCPPQFEHTELHNKVYENWKNTWGQIFTEHGNAKALVPDDFYRQDIIPVILHKGEIAAFHLYTFFNLHQQVVPEHRYFSIFDNSILQMLKAAEKTYLMSMEFLTVMPDWRKTHTHGISLGAVISCLGLKVMKETSHAAIAPARKETKVDQLAYSLGATCLKTDVQRGNLHCDLIAVYRENIKESSDFLTRRCVNHLWENLKDYTGLIKTTDKTNIAKPKAA